MIFKQGTYLYTIAAIAFIANFIWENLHDSWYVGYNPIMQQAFYLGCTLGDVLLTFFVYGLVAWVQRELFWIKRLRWEWLLLALIFSVVIAVLAEWMALELELWDYNEKMPLVPLIGIGLSPFLQITLLPTLTFYFSHRIAR